MTADVLREAARLMRDNATKAEPGRWKLWGMTVMADPKGTSNVDDAIEVAHTRTPSTTDRLLHTGNATHIASWHPAVALAVADWLVSVAAVVDRRDNPRRVGGRFQAMRIPDESAALTVARAYLGEQA